MIYTVEISDEEEKALLTDMASIQDWLNNAIHNKARQCIDAIVSENSDKIPSKLTEKEKYQIVASANTVTAAERSAEIDITKIGSLKQ